jgi:hypothetical protein
VFGGWEVPFKADTDSGGEMISGNACLNLVGDPAVILEWIETKQLNTAVNDEAKAKIFVWPEKRPNCSIKPELLYPDIQRHHTAVNHLKQYISDQHAG